MTDHQNQSADSSADAKDPKKEDTKTAQQPATGQPKTEPTQDQK